MPNLNISGLNISGINVAPVIATGDLYSFTTFTFTSANVAGRAGPTLSQCLANYNTVDNSWLNNTDYFNVPVQGIQLWTVPKSGTYRITAVGARGGKNLNANLEGGLGAQIVAEISLTQNDKIAIVVGQEGRDRPNNAVSTYYGAGGGGGTFVYDNTSSIFYVVAGGGGGAAAIRANLLTNRFTAHGKGNSIHGSNVSISNSYFAEGGRNGNGGNTSNRGSLFGGPGAGILSDGQPANGLQGRSKANNWLGGNAVLRSNQSVQGGFGGGGAGGDGSNNVSYVNINWAGGGGGYSGGAAGGNGGTGDGQYGGGGGSYTLSGYVSNVTGTNNGNGYVIVTLIN